MLESGMFNGNHHMLVPARWLAAGAVLLGMVVIPTWGAVFPPGDLNHDSVVNLRDFGLLSAQWAQTEPPWGNLAGDHIVGLDDLSVLADHWLDRVSPVVINELLAINTSEQPLGPGELLDEDGDDVDWLELYNMSSVPVDLSGWFLTDDPDDLTRWRLPSETVLDPGQYRVVLASGKDRTDPAGALHTDFKLDGSGEYLALVYPDGQTVAHAYHQRDARTGRPGYPPQRADCSYGLVGGDVAVERYFQCPTPGGPNAEPSLGIISDVEIIPPRGFYDTPIQVTLGCVTSQAAIHYTLDGSTPDPGRSPQYTEPISITDHTVLRAAAFHADYLPSRTTTHTYLIGADASVKSLPVVSLVGDEQETFYMPHGICAIRGGEYRSSYVSWHPVEEGDYNHPMGHGRAYERPVSVEMLHADATPGFQANCGIRVSGSTYTRSRYRLDSKFSFRLYFRDDYGLDWLEYPFIPSAPVQRLQHIVLRGGQSDPVNPFIKDELGRRLQRDMGSAACNGAFVNLFINGRYQGYYNPCERIDEEMLQEQYRTEGAWNVIHNWRPEDDDYDWQPGDPVDRPYRFEARDGDRQAMEALLDFLRTHDLAEPEHYATVGDQVDLRQFVDYLVLEGYCNHGDWPHNNWTAARLCDNGPLGRWRFYVWDIEHSFGPNWLTGPFKAPSSGGDIQVIGILYENLRANPEFRQLFADRVQRHLFNGGALQAEHVIERYNELHAAMAGVLPNMSTYIPDTWAPQRPGIVLESLKAKGLFTFEGPRLRINGEPCFGGVIRAGDVLSLDNPHGSGTVYYTLDGSDPRRPSEVNDPVPPAQPTGRILWEYWTGIGGTSIDSLVTSAGYPDEPSGSQFLPGLETPYRWDDNYGSRLRGYVYPPETGTYTFWLASDDHGQLLLSPNNLAGSAVLVAHVAGWTRPYEWDKYDSQQSVGIQLEGGKAYYVEVLQKDGEGGDHAMVAWSGPGLDRQVIDGAYLAEYTPPTQTPQIGENAVVYNRPLILADTVFIRARTLDEGRWSGLVEAEYYAGPTVVINEIVADNGRTIEDPDEPGEYPDWIELTNAGPIAVNLEQMALSDDCDDPAPWRINAPIILEPGEHLVIWADGDPDQGPCHADFKLDRAGETVVLFGMDGRIVIDQVQFGPLGEDVSLARIPDGIGAWGVTAGPTPGSANPSMP